MKPTAPSMQKTKGARVVIAKKGGNSDDKVFKENMKRYEQDLIILSKKIAACQGDNATVPGLVLPSQPESLFVTNLRNSVEGNSAGNEITLRLNMLERLMEKMGELDRVILKNTALGTTTGRPRRKSKDGSDLFCMPTHLLLVDRLLDVFTMSQRLQIIEKQRGSGAPDGGSSEEVKKQNSEISKLRKQLAEAEVARDKYKSFATAKDAELEAHRRAHNTVGGDSSKLTVTGEGRSIVAVAVGAGPENFDQSREIAALKASLEKSERWAVELEERVEVLAASEQSTLSGLASLSFALGNSQEVPTSDSLSLQFLNAEAKKATDQLLATVVSLVSSKSRRAVEQYNDMLQENKLIAVELEAYRATAQVDLARKNAEILALQESLSGAYAANEQADSALQAAKDSSARSRKELIQEYESKLLDLRSEHASSATAARQLEQARSRVKELEHKCQSAEDKSSELQGSLGCVRSDLAALESMNKTLMEKIRTMTNQANKNDFADTFEEVMREEMMAMKGAFEAKLKIAREQTEAMSKRHSTEISRIEASRSTSKLR